jgi:hypothetical protein
MRRLCISSKLLELCRSSDTISTREPPSEVHCEMISEAPVGLGRRQITWCKTEFTSVVFSRLIPLTQSCYGAKAVDLLNIMPLKVPRYFTSHHDLVNGVSKR